MCTAVLPCLSTRNVKMKVLWGSARYCQKILIIYRITPNLVMQLLHPLLFRKQFFKKIAIAIEPPYSVYQNHKKYNSYGCLKKVSNSCVKYKNVNVRVRRMCKSELGCRGILAFRGSPFLPHILIRRVPPESERGASALLTPPVKAELLKG